MDPSTFDRFDTGASVFTGTASSASLSSTHPSVFFVPGDVRCDDTFSFSSASIAEYTAGLHQDSSSSLPDGDKTYL
jgi:hypothetical protein